MITGVSAKVPRKRLLAHHDLVGFVWIPAWDVAERRFLGADERVLRTGAHLVTGVFRKVARKGLLAHLDLAGFVWILA